MSSLPMNHDSPNIMADAAISEAKVDRHFSIESTTLS